MAKPANNVNLLQGVLALCFALVAIYFQRLYQSDSRKPHSPAVTDSVRDITYLGTYSSADVERFENIFYAEEPTGPRRFAPPVPVKPVRGSVIDATQAGAYCPQGRGDVLPFTSRVVNISENCLSLRLARPRGTDSSAKLPVLVFIHGGGHALGSGSDILYEPDGLVTQAAKDGQPLIYVAINYRLGLFGFADSDALHREKMTNGGLRDQRAALEWVRDNIGAFGGDPDRVTASGQSVGASDIGLHLTSYQGKKGVPFQQAILISGGPGHNFNTKSDLVKTNTAAISEQVGCVRGGDSQSKETLKCLQEAPMETLMNLSVTAARAARPPFGEAHFFPTHDGDIVPDRPSTLLRQGKFVKGVPIIASWVTNEGAWYASPTVSNDEEVLASFAAWAIGLSSSTKARLLELYPLADFEHMAQSQEGAKTISAHYYRAAQINKDIRFTCPVVDFAWHYSKSSGPSQSHMWLYEHNSTRFTPTFETMGVPMWRVAHLSDVPYLLNSQHLEGGADNSAAQLELGRTISRSIVAFVNSGAPEGDSGIKKWPTAFHGAEYREFQDEFPSTLSLQLLGGAYGTQPVAVKRKMDASTATTPAQQAIAWEKLFDRCDFINSEKVRQELAA